MRNEWETWNWSAWRTEGWVGILYRNARVKLMGADSFQWCAAKEQGQHAKTGSQHVPNKHEKKFFTVRVTENRLPREAEESLFLEIFKRPIWMLFCSNYYRAPALAEGLKWMISRGLLQPLQFCDTVMKERSRNVT